MKRPLRNVWDVTAENFQIAACVRTVWSPGTEGKAFPGSLSRHDVSRAFRSVADAIRVPADAVLHSTRHTMLSELGAAGVDAATFQLIAGHEDIRTSQRYLHPTPENVVRAFERMHTLRRETASDMRPELGW